MTLRRLGSAWLMIAVLGMAVLTIGVGLCVFDGPHDSADDHAMAIDLCLGMLVTSVSRPLVARPTEAGEAPAAELTSAEPVVPAVPAPPPKLAPSA